MIIQIRGTSGSGKSTLARAVMALYPEHTPHHVEKRKQPIRYTCSGPQSKSLSVLGHYAASCGGCDTISSFDTIFGMAREEHAKGHDVLMEGLLMSGDSRRIMELCAAVPEHLVVSLTTPVEDCLNNIRKRRAAKGNDKPLSEDNTRSKHAYNLKLQDKLKAAGVRLLVADYDTAFLAIQEALNVRH